MALRTFTIEIRVDHDDPKKDELMRQAARVSAKHLLTTAMLLQDKRAPSVALESGDMFEANKEVMLADDIEPEAPEGSEAATEGAHSSNAETARVAGYTVSDKGSGWRFNDPDGKWSDQAFTTEASAWEGAYADIVDKPA